MTSEQIPENEGTTLSETRSSSRGLLGRLRPRLPKTPGDRRRLLVVGLIGTAIVVGLVLIPVLVATRPTFLRRYEALEPSYTSWSSSVHAKVPCQKCHVAPGVVPQTTYGARMLGEYYLSLVMPSRAPKLFEKPTNAACSSCHLDLRTVSPKGDLNIPHRAHVTVLRLKCNDCHSYLVHEVSAEGKHSPPMSGCLTCHDGRRAKNSCAACHTEKAEPETHRAANWIVVHSDKVGEVECNSCHKWTEKWCSNCHETRPRSHAADWRSKHGDQVKVRRNCEACHTQEFCVRCHGELPKDNYDPALKLVQ